MDTNITFEPYLYVLASKQFLLNMMKKIHVFQQVFMYILIRFFFSRISSAALLDAYGMGLCAFNDCMRVPKCSEIYSSHVA